MYTNRRRILFSLQLLNLALISSKKRRKKKRAPQLKKFYSHKSSHVDISLCIFFFSIQNKSTRIHYYYFFSSNNTFLIKKKKEVKKRKASGLSIRRQTNFRTHHIQVILISFFLVCRKLS